MTKAMFQEDRLSLLSSTLLGQPPSPPAEVRLRNANSFE